MDEKEESTETKFVDAWNEVALVNELYLSDWSLCDEVGDEVVRQWREALEESMEGDTKKIDVCHVHSIEIKLSICLCIMCPSSSVHVCGC